MGTAVNALILRRVSGLGDPRQRRQKRGVGSASILFCDRLKRRALVITEWMLLEKLSYP
jgi:hypothetical protein